MIFSISQNKFIKMKKKTREVKEKGDYGRGKITEGKRQKI
jgi:hypothetical protein